mmetsp:Transcript_36962/g.96830  ORF Transcript_36962/g.96830 Transcript_36962/m.96830 type:complete len:467 (+) Transcript_36962:170-1570(+)
MTTGRQNAPCPPSLIPPLVRSKQEGESDAPAGLNGVAIEEVDTGLAPVTLPNNPLDRADSYIGIVGKSTLRQPCQSGEGAALTRVAEIDLSHLGTCGGDHVARARPPVDDAAAMAVWYGAGLPRDQLRSMATALLNDGKRGEFLIRDKQSEMGAFALSVKDSAHKLLTFLICWNSAKKCFCVRGTKEFFPTLSALIAAYSENAKTGLGIQLQEPGPYMRVVATTGAGIPAWLSVDDALKAETLLKRKVNIAWQDGQSDATYELATTTAGSTSEEDDTAVYSVATQRRQDSNTTDRGPDYALATSNNGTVAYSRAKATDDPDYQLAAGTDDDNEAVNDDTEYDTAKRESALYDVANRQSCAIYATARRSIVLEDNDEAAKRLSLLYDEATLLGLTDVEHPNAPDCGAVESDYSMMSEASKLSQLSGSRETDVDAINSSKASVCPKQTQRKKTSLVGRLFFTKRSTKV